jgi:hypothetical protein
MICSLRPAQKKVKPEIQRAGGGAAIPHALIKSKETYVQKRISQLPTLSASALSTLRARSPIHKPWPRSFYASSSLAVVGVSDGVQLT